MPQGQGARRRQSVAAGSSGGGGEQKKHKKGQEGTDTAMEEEEKPATYRVTVKEMEAAMPVIVKATLSSLQSNRDLEAVLLDVGLLERGSKVATAMKQATTEWSEKVKESGKGHNHGPPHLSAWEALLRSLIGEEIGAANRKLMQEAYDKYKEQTLEQKSLDVRLCRLKKTYDKDKVKIQLALRGQLEHLRGTVREAMKQAGCELKSGRAPMGGLERKLQEMLENWQI